MIWFVGEGQAGRSCNYVRHIEIWAKYSQPRVDIYGEGALFYALVSREALCVLQREETIASHSVVVAVTNQMDLV